MPRRPGGCGIRRSSGRQPRSAERRRRSSRSCLWTGKWRNGESRETGDGSRELRTPSSRLPSPDYTRLPALAGDLAGDDVEAVPDVDAGDGEDEGREGGLVVVAGGFVPDVVGDGVGAVAEAGGGLGEGEGGAFGVGEVGRLAPGGDGEEAVVSLAEFAGDAGVVDGADTAAVDLAGTQIDELQGLRWQTGLLNGLSQSLQSIHRVGNDIGRVVHSRFHQGSPSTDLRVTSTGVRSSH